MDQGTSLKNIEAGSNGRVSCVKLEDGSSIEADVVSWCCSTSYTPLDIRKFMRVCVCKYIYTYRFVCLFNFGCHAAPSCDKFISISSFAGNCWYRSKTCCRPFWKSRFGFQCWWYTGTLLNLRCHSCFLSMLAVYIHLSVHRIMNHAHLTTITLDKKYEEYCNHVYIGFYFVLLLCHHRFEIPTTKLLFLPRIVWNYILV